MSHTGTLKHLYTGHDTRLWLSLCKQYVGEEFHEVAGARRLLGASPGIGAAENLFS